MQSKSGVEPRLLGPLPPKDESIQSTILFTENIAALLPANHPLAKEKAYSLQS